MKHTLLSSLAFAGLLLITSCDTVEEPRPTTTTTTTTEETTRSSPYTTLPLTKTVETQTTRSY
jgi:hypothetical protein